MADQNGFGTFSVEQVRAFAASPAGKRLMELIQNQSGADLSKAQAYAAAGNMEQAKAELAALMADPKIKELLRQFGG